ncbi:hypothetical protein [Halomonas sp. KO116]|uniref:hypothetical protein n=1 Tax=Halomonas sp. KO116 TaxID=1504981 RepID=UPI0004E45F64|nr:hypothetical protein [Halomonas sp. KO116]AJY53128.1 hypothetical protein KO116_P200021 [Halomonas sp. KO116]
MKKLTLIACIATASILSGCASTGTSTADRRFSEDNSRAYNLAQAGGLHEARDTELGDDQYSYMMSNLADGASTGLSLASSSGFGLSGGTSLGIGLATALLSGPGMMGFDSAFAFVPESMASNPSDAAKVITNSFYESAKAGEDEAGYSLRVTDESFGYRHSSKREVVSFTFVNESLGCSDPDKIEKWSAEYNCVLALIHPTETRKLADTPLAVRDSAGARSYAVHAHDNTRALQTVVKFSKQAEELLGEERLAQERLALLQTVSANMPSWYFIYETPKEYTPPMVITEGETELFITRK